MFFKKIDKRIKIVLIIIMILFVSIVLRVFKIQVFDYKKLKYLADDLWSRDLEVAADRGKILDRTGSVLVTSETTKKKCLRLLLKYWMLVQKRWINMYIRRLL